MNWFTKYGEGPVHLGRFELAEWQEFMHYLYLPVRMVGPDSPAGTDRRPQFRYPERLAFLAPMVEAAWRDSWSQGHPASYVYLTVRRGFASPDNPLNRPGWHCDGFGTDDVNYVWWDTHSTRFALQDFDEVNPGHVESMCDFEAQIRPECVVSYEDRGLYRLSPYVVHATPEIPAPGCLRSFVKISCSKHRYNLEGNSHNYLFEYDWPMHPRSAARNDPIYGEADFVPEAP